MNAALDMRATSSAGAFPVMPAKSDVELDEPGDDMAEIHQWRERKYAEIDQIVFDHAGECKDDAQLDQAIDAILVDEDYNKLIALVQKYQTIETIRSLANIEIGEWVTLQDLVGRDRAVAIAQIVSEHARAILQWMARPRSGPAPKKKKRDAPLAYVYDESMPIEFREAMLARDTAQACLLTLFAFEKRYTHTCSTASGLAVRYLRDAPKWLDALRAMGLTISEKVAPVLVDWKLVEARHQVGERAYKDRLAKARSNGTDFYPPLEADDSAPRNDAKEG